jgi:hypothetical protein
MLEVTKDRLSSDNVFCPSVQNVFACLLSKDIFRHTDIWFGLLLYMGVKLGLSREEKTWVED